MARMAELVRDKHPRALKLQAEMLEGQHKAREALKMYEEAIKSAAEGRTQGETLEESAMDQIGRAPDERESATDGAWTAIGRIYLHELRDLEKAKSAFQEGALKADDPEAYHLLARFEIEDSEFPIYTEQYVEYETKAAASGHPEAALALANFYAMSPEESKVKTTPAAWKMFDQAGDMTEQGRLQWARQWCELACETPPVYPQAMLLYLKISIQLDDAKSALAKAREWVEYVSDFPPQLRKMWQEVARTLGDEQLAG